VKFAEKIPFGTRPKHGFLNPKHGFTTRKHGFLRPKHGFHTSHGLFTMPNYVYDASLLTNHTYLSLISITIPPFTGKVVFMSSFLSILIINSYFNGICNNSTIMFLYCATILLKGVDVHYVAKSPLFTIYTGGLDFVTRRLYPSRDSTDCFTRSYERNITIERSCSTHDEQR
jgi:hypothetical protein